MKKQTIISRLLVEMKKINPQGLRIHESGGNKEI